MWFMANATVTLSSRAVYGPRKDQSSDDRYGTQRSTLTEKP